MSTQPLSALLIVLGAMVGSSCSSRMSEHLGTQTHAIVGGQTEALPLLEAVGAVVFSESDGSVVLHCTATLTGSDLVTTAAHCVRTAPSEKTLRFFLGRDLAEMSAEDMGISVVSAEVHPEYRHRVPPTELAPLHDLAILRLARPVSEITPIPLASVEQAQDALVTGREAIVAGFGLTDPADQDSYGRRLSGRSPIARVGEWEFRIDGPTAAQKCRGDSGGPTLATLSGGTTRAVLIGVASRAGADCTLGSSETRIDAHLDWLRSYNETGSGPGCALGAGQPTAAGMTLLALVGLLLARRSSSRAIPRRSRSTSATRDGDALFSGRRATVALRSAGDGSPPPHPPLEQ
jgi:secreted trypsin-like serine protease